jgi:hypothetical protein
VKSEVEAVSQDSERPSLDEGTHPLTIALRCRGHSGLNRSLAVCGVDQRIALERRHFLFKLQDPIIETLQRRSLKGSLKGFDHMIKSDQGTSPSPAGGR